MRTIVWFSCGAASAVASYLTLQTSPDAILVYCDTGGEHPDNKRFMADVEKWLKKEVIVLKNTEYSDHFDVVEKTRYVNGPSGARCTAELKKKLRLQFQEVDDIQVFGYTADVKDRARATRFENTFPEVYSRFPLIEKSLTKQNCLGVLTSVGISVPVMYKLGFENNNCIGCVKGGKGYWNRVRSHFPEQFERMAKIERSIGHSCINGIFLDELDPESGHKTKEADMSCDFICQSVIV